MPLLIATFFIAMVAYLDAQIMPAQAADRNTMIADAQATKFLAYRAGVVAYFADSANACNGTSANAAFLPNYFTAGFNASSIDLRWNNQCLNGTVYVYEAVKSAASTSPLDENLLFHKTGGAAMLGRLNWLGSFVGTNLMLLPGGVPAAVTNSIDKPALIMVGG